jgi:hypothetical protein
VLGDLLGKSGSSDYDERSRPGQLLAVTEDTGPTWQQFLVAGVLFRGCAIPRWRCGPARPCYRGHGALRSAALNGTGTPVDESMGFSGAPGMGRSGPGAGLFDLVCPVRGLPALAVQHKVEVVDDNGYRGVALDDRRCPAAPEPSGLPRIGVADPARPTRMPKRLRGHPPGLACPTTQAGSTGRTRETARDLPRTRRAPRAAVSVGRPAVPPEIDGSVSGAERAG